MSEVTFSFDAPRPKEFFALFESTGWNEEYKLSAPELHKAIQSSWFVVSAYQDARLVGFGRVVSDGVLHAMIYDVIVDPKYQRQGIGAEVMSKLLARCKQAGIKDVQLFCAKGKAGFYRKLGFADRPADAPGMELAKLYPE